MSKRVYLDQPTVRELDGSGGRAYRQKDGSFKLSDADARHAAIAGVATVVPDMGPGRKGDGYRCTNPDCLRGSYFKTCGKCGSGCERE